VNHSYEQAATQQVSGDNRIDYAYREVGEGATPLLLLQHFRGNLDNWDPALIDDLSASRRIITFDNVGVGATSGSTPHTVDEMAEDALTFLDALGLDCIDVLGFSIGSFVAQEILLARPDAVRRVILASSAPRGAAGMHGWAPHVIKAVGQREPNPAGYLDVFFTGSAASKEAGAQTLKRILARQNDRDQPTTWQTRLAQYDAVCAWGIPDHSRLERVGSIDHPVFIANGDRDPMILPRYSHLLAGLIADSEIKTYPDSAHGFLFQHHTAFASDVDRFLARGDRAESRDP
jgi:pimeloyl-ACP methyl ester carboxylesterase